MYVYLVMLDGRVLHIFRERAAAEAWVNRPSVSQAARYFQAHVAIEERQVIG